MPAPARGRVIAQVGRLVEANKEALARAGHARDRQALPRGAGRGAGDRRHLRLLPRRGPAALRADRAVGDAGQAAVHVPVPVGVAAIITAGNFPVAVPSWYLVPAILCGNAVVWKPAEYAPRWATRWRSCSCAGGVPGGVLNVVQADGRGHVRRPRARAGARAWSTRSASPAPARSARGSASCAAATCSRRAWSSAARTRWS